MDDFIKQFNERIRRAYGFATEESFNKVKFFNDQVTTRNEFNRGVEDGRFHGLDTHHMSARLATERDALDKGLDENRHKIDPRDQERYGQLMTDKLRIKNNLLPKHNLDVGRSNELHHCATRGGCPEKAVVRAPATLKNAFGGAQHYCPSCEARALAAGFKSRHELEDRIGREQFGQTLDKRTGEWKDYEGTDEAVAQGNDAVFQSETDMKATGMQARKVLLGLLSKMTPSKVIDYLNQEPKAVDDDAAGEVKNAGASGVTGKRGIMDTIEEMAPDSLTSLGRRKVKLFRNDDEKKIPGTFKDAIKTELTHLTPVALIKSMNAIDTLNQRSLFAKAGEEIEGEEEIRVPGVDLEKAMERQSFKKLAKQWSDNQYIRNIIKNEIFQTFDDNLVAPEKIARARDLDFIGSTGMHARSTVKRLLRGRTAAALLRHLSQPPHEQDHTDLYELRNLGKRGGKYREWLLSIVDEAIEEKLRIAERENRARQ